jgi:hypothetical protein
MFYYVSLYPVSFASLHLPIQPWMSEAKLSFTYEIPCVTANTEHSQLKMGFKNLTFWVQLLTFSYIQWVIF